MSSPSSHSKGASRKLRRVAHQKECSSRRHSGARDTLLAAGTSDTARRTGAIRRRYGCEAQIAAILTRSPKKVVKICDVKQRLKSEPFVRLMPPSVGSLEPQTATGCSREYLYVLRRLPGRGLTFPIATVRYGPLKVTAF